MPFSLSCPGCRRSQSATGSGNTALELLPLLQQQPASGDQEAQQPSQYKQDNQHSDSTALVKQHSTGLKQDKLQGAGKPNAKAAGASSVDPLVAHADDLAADAQRLQGTTASVHNMISSGACSRSNPGNT